jgi:uncharacterized protein YraI
MNALAIPNCAKGTATVTATALRVRAGPGLQHPQAGRLLAQGETVTVWAAPPDWWIVQAADGLTGWASAKYLQPVSELQP